MAISAFGQGGNGPTGTIPQSTYTTLPTSSANGIGTPLYGITFAPSIGTAEVLCNNQAAPTLNACGNTGAVFQISADGSLTLAASVGGAPKTELYMNTTGDIKLFTAFAPDAVGFATDHNNNLCISTGQPVTSNHDCTDSHVWEWNTSGRLAKVVGQNVCLNANAACGYFPVPCWAAGISIGLVANVSNFSLITTGANNDTNASPCNAGLYEWDYWLKATTAVASNVVQITLTCIDEGGTTQNVNSPSFTFATTNAFAQGSLFCFSGASQAIKVSYTNSGGASVPTYDAKGSLWHK